MLNIFTIKVKAAIFGGFTVSFAEVQKIRTF
jgi:hypothetical protein